MFSAKTKRIIALLYVCAAATGSIQPLLAVELTPLALIKVPLQEAYIHKPVIIDENQKLTATDLLALRQLTDAQKIHLLLKKYEQLPAASLAKPTKIDPNFIKKMELMNGEGTAANNLLNILNRTQTVSGKIATAKTLVAPTYDIPTLQHRQVIITTLLEDERLFNSLSKELATLGTNESDLLSYFDEESKAAQELLNQVYFGSWLDKLNDSSIALEARTRLGNAGDLFNFSFLPALLTIQLTGINWVNAWAYKTIAKVSQNANTGVPSWGIKSPEESLIPLGDHLKQAYNEATSQTYKALYDGPFGKTSYTTKLIPADKLYETMDKISLFSHIKESVKTVASGIAKWYNPFAKTYSDGAPQTQHDLCYDKAGNKINPTSLGDYLTIYRNSPEEVRKNVFPRSESSTKSQAILLGGLAAITAFQIWKSKGAMESALFKKAITNYLHTKTLSVAHYIKALRTISSHIKARPVLAQTPEFKPLVDLFDNATGKLKKVLSLLNSSTFKGDQATILSLSGRVLAAHKLLTQVKEELIPAIDSVGYVDMYVSTARLLKDFAQESVTYCFPHYVTDSKPYIQAINFWNPFIEPGTAIANTIEFGTSQNPNNAILTGPNTGGKTTTIKGILINLLLAQTLGIAAAESLTLTPFAHLNCYLNVTDDLGAGTSLFKAEVMRAKELLEGIRSLAPNQFSFTLMDEVFSGTSPLEGEQAALQFALQMSKFANSMSILATHYQKMPLLESQLSTLAQQFDPSYQGGRFNFKNYRVTMYKDQAGHWIRPFKIEPGVSDVNVALDLLKEEGIL